MPSLEELEEIAPYLYMKECMRLKTKRAEERMTLRHKNTSKWAQRILRRGKEGKMDPKSRKALMEQLERGRALRRKIKGLDSDDDSDELDGGRKEKEMDQEDNRGMCVESRLTRQEVPCLEL